MGLFNAKQGKKAEPIPAKPVPKSQLPVSSRPAKQGTSTISPGLTLEGKTTCHDDMEVQGTIKGELSCSQHVLVGTGGKVLANIDCHSITIEGEVKGNISAKESIHIQKSGRVFGDIETKILINEPGGFFEGSSRMLVGPKNG